MSLHLAPGAAVGATPDQWVETALGKYIGYLPQNLELLAGAIRDNIARFEPEADYGAVIKAAKIASVIVMAHRPSAIQAVTKVQVLHGGRVAEFSGTDKILQTPSQPAFTLRTSGRATALFGLAAFAGMFAVVGVWSGKATCCCAPMLKFARPTRPIRLRCSRLG